MTENTIICGERTDERRAKRNMTDQFKLRSLVPTMTERFQGSPPPFRIPRYASRKPPRQRSVSHNKKANLHAELVHYSANADYTVPDQGRA